MSFGEIVGTVREHQKRTYEVKVGMAAVVLSLIAGYTAVGQLRYMVFGKFSQASFADVHTKVTRDKVGRKTKTPYVRYSFADESMSAEGGEDDGKQVGLVIARRVESDIQDYGWTPLPAKWTMSVQYLPGSAGSSRLAGHAQRWVCYAFFGFTIVGTGVAIWVIRDYHANTRGKAAW